MDRFWEKAERGAPTACWPWTAARDGTGYGAFKIGGKKRNAHVVAWEIANGTSAPRGMDVMHSCDNKACVNPAHLSLGTRSQNQKDAYARGLQKPTRLTREQYSRCGQITAAKTRKISPEQVWLVKRILATGPTLTHVEIGRMFGITGRHVTDIKRGKTFRSVAYP